MGIEEQISELDLSVEEGLKVLASADMRIITRYFGDKPYLNHQIWYKGEWWDLSRTDLIDNIATSCSFHSNVDMSNLDEVRNYFAEKINYGVRLNVFSEDNKCFCCVDSYTDG